MDGQRQCDTLWYMWYIVRTPVPIWILAVLGCRYVLSCAAESARPHACSLRATLLDYILTLVVGFEVILVDQD